MTERRRLLDAAVLERLPDLAAKARALADGAFAGLHASARRGPSAELVDRRPYTPGDDPRRIDWRVYARTRQLLVKRARRDADLPVYLVLDASASMTFKGPRAFRSKLEHARLLAAALAHIFLEAGDRVGLLGFGAGAPSALAPSGGGRRRLVRLAASLEALEPGGSADAAAAVRALRPMAHRRGVVVLISDLLPEGDQPLDPLYRELRAFVARGHDVIVLQVRDPEEADLALAGPWRFVDPETTVRRDADTSVVRGLYARNAGEFLARARSLAHEAAIDHALAPTDRSPVEPLAAILATRHRTRAASRRGFAA
jgi:uncharacterized protein (DUF58 family)